MNTTTEPMTTDKLCGELKKGDIVHADGITLYVASDPVPATDEDTVKVAGDEGKSVVTFAVAQTPDGEAVGDAHGIAEAPIPTTTQDEVDRAHLARSIIRTAAQFSVTLAKLEVPAAVAVVNIETEDAGLISLTISTSPKEVDKNFVDMTVTNEDGESYTESLTTEVTDVVANAAAIQASIQAYAQQVKAEETFAEADEFLRSLETGPKPN